MNKKGFTLIELLAVLIIIGIIGLITVGSITSLLKTHRNNIYNKQLDNIKSATMIWGADHMLILPNDTNSTNICNYNDINNCEKNYKILVLDLQTLQINGYIDSNLKNPKTKQAFENIEIQIIKNGNNLEYVVGEVNSSNS
jgi:prepilin-type N-terminal cleavage/methylation domain-containing protein